MQPSIMNTQLKSLLSDMRPSTALPILMALFVSFVAAAQVGKPERPEITPFTPAPEDIQKAEGIAKPYVYRILAGRDSPPISFRQAAKDGSLTNSVSGVIPRDFSIGTSKKVLYSDYKRKYVGIVEDDHRRLYICYFDPGFFPDWEKREGLGMMGGFSAYFTVTVDLTDGKVVDHYASPM
jgi:hypothetical protein